MASQKTLPSEQSVDAFIAASKRSACGRGKSVSLIGAMDGRAADDVGNQHRRFGSYRYRYDSGHEGTAPLVGFAPRKANLVLYLVGGLEDRYPKLLQRLGPHKVGKGCLYLKRLDVLDQEVLRSLVERTVRVHRGASRRAGA
ncbi:MAG: DUF1801 domain-containing protein [Solirubrobacteraceae bacterium]